MKYSAGMTSKVFAFVESKKIAELIVQGLSKDEITELITNENSFGLRDASRIKYTINYVYKRVSELPYEAIEIIASTDIENAKLLVLVGIMKTDLLFGEFVYEVYRMKLILGEKEIENRDLNEFFIEKADQSDIVSKWSEAGIKKLKNCYIRNLIDAGLIEDTKSRKVKQAFIGSKIEKILVNNDMTVFLKAIKGER